MNRKRGYWKSWENTKVELERLTEELGHFPISKEIHPHGGLDTAINRYYGGLLKIRAEMGYPQLRKPHRYWKNRENVEKEIKEIVEEYGYFPSFSKLRESKHRSIINALAAHGGIVKFRKLIKSRKPRHYWSDIENVSKELKRITKSLGHFPSSYELSKLGYTNLATAIYQHHNGIDKVREKMGYEKFVIIKPSGYWKDINNVIKEIEIVIGELGHFPTHKEFVKIGKFSLEYSMTKYHGGIDKVREKMDYSVIKNKEQFISFLSNDQTARNLAVVALSVNGFRSDIEQIINEIYGGKFKNQKLLRDLIDESTDEIYELIQGGITNLGYFIGGYSLDDKKIIPVLLGDVINNIPEEKITSSLEERLLRILRTNYGPRFNENPQEIITELEDKVESTSGNKRKLYEALQTHYTDIVKLQEELR
ncbi:MAG TPA: hypothetical protein VJJ23_00245 [Candidatus Nanoarchaeia archaeon]|nr:hypothetical protein [Candidatus Nanoarchaeia archaeon]